MTTTAATASPSEALEQRVKDALRNQLLARAMATEAAAEAAAEPVVEEKEEPVTAAPGQVLFSKLINKPLPTGLRDFAVTVLDLASLPAQVKAFVPKLKADYNVQVEEAHALMMAWETGDKVLITGPTGAGKSTLVAFCAALTHRPFIRINMTGDIESTVLFGQLVVESGATVWKDGPVTEACRYGAVCCIDEWDVTPPEILFGLQYLLEEDGKLFLKEMPGESNDKFIVPHEHFRLCCLGNTVGQGDDTGRYSGTNVQNNASIDRFQTTIVLDYLDTEHEKKIILDNCKGVKPSFAAQMVSFANLVRTACKQGNINLTMSPRTLINWGRKVALYKDNRRALLLSFGNKLRDTDRKIVSEFFTKVFGGNL